MAIMVNKIKHAHIQQTQEERSFEVLKATQEAETGTRFIRKMECVSQSNLQVRLITLLWVFWEFLKPLKHFFKGCNLHKNMYVIQSVVCDMTLCRKAHIDLKKTGNQQMSEGVVGHAE